MKNCFKLMSLFLGMLLCATAFVACGDDDDDNGKKGGVPDADEITVNDLIGTWTVNSSDNSYVAIFTKDNVTLKENGEVQFSGNYSIANGVLTIPGQNGMKFQSVPGLLYGKSVLVLKQVYESERGNTENLGFVLFKQGKTVTATSQDIQGFWCWYSDFGAEEIIRAAIKINGNNFELIITPWGQRYVGTYTYESGIIHFNVTAGFTSRDEHSGDGSLWGDMDPKTLEFDDWRTLDPDRWQIYAVSENPFIANGDEAYGFVANLPAIFTKKK
jgi:hypothetical protein